MLLSPLLLIAATAWSGPPSATKTIREIALSPDGKRLAWVGPASATDPRPPAIIVTALGNLAAAVRITIGRDAGERDLAWAPDGNRLAFVATGPDGEPGLYVVPAAGGAARRIGGIRGLVAHPEWSPDGRRIAFLNTENATKQAGPLVAAARDTGVIGRHVDYQRIAVVDLASGKLSRASPANLYVHEFHWSPDGTRFVAAAGPGPGDAGWYVDEIQVIDVATAAARSLGTPGMQVAMPVWSPDGTRIAYVGGLMSDEVAVGGDVWVVPAAGGSPKNLTPEIKISPNWLAWPSGSKEILFTAWADGGSAVGTVDPESGAIESKWSGPETISGLTGIWLGTMALSRDGATSAVIRNSFEAPPEIWAGPVGAWRKVTSINDGLKATWGTAQSLRWKSDSFAVQGWLLAPAGVTTSRRHPMVVVVHGGPAAAHTAHWLSEGNATELALLKNGYFVFLPNPRGSQGFGEKFTRANVKDFGYGDLRDILAGVDETIRSMPVDSAAIGITGWSYGGYMTMWAVTQTNRFRAAVAGAGMANYLSYWAQNGINDWMHGYFGTTVYDDPEIYARSAPITFIKQARTPTLVLVGEKDIETPAAQSFEFWKGLQHNGVETQLVVYPDEGHGIRQPAHVKDRIERSLAWFDKYLKAKPVP
jgi:dipeptidyl aminopeptidase/acylaminoacyl peptidase